ncbi:hypothetical protein GPJ56_007317 [Histomonas meleagridis]|uniref:uncharacterized protein n=1 Tax=Histomonas meleagridis TaxID=135588 RepID=UPI003559BA60|nr:hypothetical protein GPJ56_007317 [Histomonas meleagridis]KAH0804163.1 hypothetical protein GO595_002993 [Histomonas meleagridis]
MCANQQQYAYNLCKDIPELNTPERIYEEWEKVGFEKEAKPFNMENAFKNDPTMVNDFGSLQNFILGKIYNLKMQLQSPSTDPKYIYNEIQNTIEVVFSLIMFYRKAEHQKPVKDYSSRNPSQFKLLYDGLNKNGSDVLISLQQFKVHSCVLADPGSPKPQYWGNLLTYLCDNVFNSVQNFLNSLYNFCINVTSFQQLNSSIIGPSEPSKPSAPVSNPYQPQTYFQNISYPSFAGNPYDYDSFPSAPGSNQNQQTDEITALTAFTNRIDQLESNASPNFLSDNQRMECIAIASEFQNLRPKFEKIYRDFMNTPENLKMQIFQYQNNHYSLISKNVNDNFAAVLEGNLSNEQMLSSIQYCNRKIKEIVNCYDAICR